MNRKSEENIQIWKPKSCLHLQRFMANQYMKVVSIKYSQKCSSLCNYIHLQLLNFEWAGKLPYSNDGCIDGKLGRNKHIFEICQLESYYFLIKD